MKKLGADHVVNDAREKEWGQYVRRELTGGIGVDCVVDVVGSDALSNSLAALRWDGEIALIEQLSVHGKAFDLAGLKMSGATLRPIGAATRTMLERVVHMVQGTCLKPVIRKVFARKDAKPAFEHFARISSMGKIVISMK